MTTREKILSVSKTYFNTHGFGAPTLYSLAKEIGISRGNLTYYFKDKETLLAALVEEMFITYTINSAKATQVISWSSLLKKMKVLHQLQKEYGFIFFDKQVLLNPLVKSQIQRMREDSIDKMMSMMSYSIKVGNMKPEPFPGIYHNINRSYWTISFYWYISKEFQSDPEETNWDKILWSLLLPHFTERGIDSFIRHFGNEYYRSLGKPFAEYEENKVEF
ncbi:MAG: hypothetical protein ACI9XO_003888 [Paraglaciecola sp.]